MKKQSSQQDDDIEILKAVAQAWHAHSGNSRLAYEYDAYRRNFQKKPSRFKLEAIHKAEEEVANSVNWDFNQSLLDAYEIVTVSKKLERGLGLDNPFGGGSEEQQSRVHRRRRESNNSLRNLFNRISSSKRYSISEVDVTRED